MFYVFLVYYIKLNKKKKWKKRLRSNLYVYILLNNINNSINFIK